MPKKKKAPLKKKTEPMKIKIGDFYKSRETKEIFFVLEVVEQRYFNITDGVSIKTVDSIDLFELYEFLG